MAGMVRDESQNPVGGATVLLLPAEIPARPDLSTFKTTRSSADGSFVFPDLAPGNYRAIAMTEADLANQGSLEFLRARAAGAGVIEVNAGQSTRVDLKR